MLFNEPLGTQHAAKTFRLKTRSYNPKFPHPNLWWWWWWWPKWYHHLCHGPPTTLICIATWLGRCTPSLFCSSSLVFLWLFQLNFIVKLKADPQCTIKCTRDFTYQTYFGTISCHLFKLGLRTMKMACVWMKSALVLNFFLSLSFCVFHVHYIIVEPCA